MAEFNRINKYFKPLAGAGSFELTDDTALIKPYVISTDTMAQGTHFIGNETPETLAQKLLAVNLSDLASSGAKPYGYTINLTLPNNTSCEWFEKFANGLDIMNKEYNLNLLGGDTTSHNGGIVISATVFGLASKSIPLRKNARVGDVVCLSGEIGAGALSLMAVNGDIDDGKLINRYQIPKPHIIQGITINPYINACIDVSDGLIADLGHIANESNVDIDIYMDDIPIDKLVEPYMDKIDNINQIILTGGDDYVLAFTVPEKLLDSLRTSLQDIGKELFPIGNVIKKENEISGVNVYDINGEILSFDKLGFQHH